MTKYSFLCEDTLLQKLPAIYSEEIKNNIENIKEYNYFEKEGLTKLNAHLEWIESHITNRSIAFNYGNNLTIESDGSIFVDYLGVRFRIEDDSKRVFVRITWIDYNLEEYGLKAPPYLYENKQHNSVRYTIHLKVSELKRIIDESVRKVLEERRNRRLNEVVDSSFRKILKEHLMNNYTKL